jgi:curved DNA-binding protein CbpA
MKEAPLGNSPIIVRVDRGISQFNHDYYAALGAPITADVNEIRQTYIGIAKILHPDVFGFTPEQKAVATQYLAKLVNPAYDVLMRERDREAYRAIFKLLAKRLMQKVRNIGIKSDVAKKLLYSPSDSAYEKSVYAVAIRQFESLDTILEYTAQLSELNLVYILYREGYQFSDPDFSSVLTYASPKQQTPNLPQIDDDDDRTVFQTTPVNTRPTVKPAKQQISPSQHQIKPTYAQNQSKDRILDQTPEQLPLSAQPLNPQSDASFATRVAAAEEYMKRKQWMQALRELRIAVQLNNKDSKCMAMLGVVYKNINQPSMAKVSFQQALKLNPKDPLALLHMKNLNVSSSTKPKPDESSKGWFFGLLGMITPDQKDRK